MSPFASLSFIANGCEPFFLAVKNVLFAKFFPISTSGAYDNTGMPYNISAVLDDQGLFDVEKYKSYSPLFMPVTLQLAYGVQFAMITAIAVHTYRKSNCI